MTTNASIFSTIAVSGGTAPYGLLTASGVDLEKKFGTPLLSPKK